MLLEMFQMFLGGVYLLSEAGRPATIRKKEEEYYKKHNYNPKLQQEIKTNLLTKPGYYILELGYTVYTSKWSEVVKAMKILMENRGYNYMSGEELDDPEYQRIYKGW